MPNDIIAFIEAMQAGPVDLVGHSRGGHIAFRVAQQRTELLRKLILAESGGELDASLRQGDSIPQTRTQRVLDAAEKIAAGDLDSGLQVYIEGLSGDGTWARLAPVTKQEYRDNARTLLGQVNEQRQPYSRKDAEAISVPTLFVLGEKTQGSLPIVLRALAASVRGSKTAVIFQCSASHDPAGAGRNQCCGA